MIDSKWTKQYFIDLGERVGATFVGALISLVTLTQTTSVEWSFQYLWPILGVPVAFSLLKGLSANLNNSESGASAVPFPAGPKVGEGGYATILGALGMGLVLLSVILLVATLLKAFVVSIPVLIILFVLGLVLLWVDQTPGNRVL